MVGKKLDLICTTQAVMDTELHMCHVATLLIRNFPWLVTSQKVGTQLFGRPIQDTLGLNNSDLPAAAAGRFSGSLDGMRTGFSKRCQNVGTVDLIE